MFQRGCRLCVIKRGFAQVRRPQIIVPFDILISGLGFPDLDFLFSLLINFHFSAGLWLKMKKKKYIVVTNILARFVQVALKNESLCATKSDGGAEDGEIGENTLLKYGEIDENGKCLWNVYVYQPLNSEML